MSCLVLLSFCLILCSKFRDLQKATYNFTTIIGHGAFGPVYKAQMSSGEIVAVKVLATNSKQGEKEFHTEVEIVVVNHLLASGIVHSFNVSYTCIFI